MRLAPRNYLITHKKKKKEGKTAGNFCDGFITILYRVRDNILEVSNRLFLKRFTHKKTYIGEYVNDLKVKRVYRTRATNADLLKRLRNVLCNSR